MNLNEVTQERLDEISHRLNSRPRKTLDFMTPSRKLSEVLQ
jgi:IS30 family transposase